MDLVKEHARKKEFLKPDTFIQNFKKKCNSLDKSKKLQKSENLDIAS